MKQLSALLIVALLAGFAVNADAQKLGNILHGVKNDVNSVKNDVKTIKSTVDEIKPEDNTNQQDQQTTSTNTQDTTKKTTNPNGTTNNIAIGDEGSNTNEKKNGSGGQVKDFVKDNKENGTKQKPYTNGQTPTSNLAIGDQGTVEETNKKNDNIKDNNAPNNTVTPKR